MAVATRNVMFIIGRFITKNQFFRHGSYYSSPFLEDVTDINRKYVVTKDPQDWKYVERILPLTVVPEVTKKQAYPSGWKPQASDLKSQPYFIERSKNHMIPVYLHISQHGIRRHTLLRHIKGNIWLLENELREFLQKDSFQPIRSQVNELAGFIRFNGDHVNAIKYWLEQKNF